MGDGVWQGKTCEQGQGWTAQQENSTSSGIPARHRPKIKSKNLKICFPFSLRTCFVSSSEVQSFSRVDCCLVLKAAWAAPWTLFKVQVLAGLAQWAGELLRGSIQLCDGNARGWVWLRVRGWAPYSLSLVISVSEKNGFIQCCRTQHWMRQHCKMLTSLYSEVRFLVASSWKFSLTLYLFSQLYSGVVIVIFFIRLLMKIKWVNTTKHLEHHLTFSDCSICCDYWNKSEDSNPEIPGPSSLQYFISPLWILVHTDCPRSSAMIQRHGLDWDKEKL